MRESHVSPTGMRILKLLVGHPPKTLATLIEETGVTRTAVTEQLANLMASGYVAREVERTGRGRPHHLYSATEASQSLFVSNISRFVPAMLQAIEEVCGAQATRDVLERVSQELAAQYAKRITATEPRERLRQLGGLLEEEGVLAEICDDNGRLILQERTCPFASMVTDSRVACEVEQSMMSLICGSQVQMLECRLDGCSCCTFELAGLEK